MRCCKIVHVRAKDFRTAVYVGLEDDTRYLVGTDHLCPDCTTPMIALEGGEDGQLGSLRMYHDPDCVIAHYDGGLVLNKTERRKVGEIRKRYLDDALEVWSELA